MLSKIEVTEVAKGFDDQILEVLDAFNAQVIQHAEGRERVLWAVSNALVANPLFHPAIRVGGRLEVRTRAPTLAAVAGDAVVRVGGRSFKPWRALPLHSGCKLDVEAVGGPVYVAFSGLRALVSQLRAGLGLIAERVSEIDGSIVARFLPQTLIRECLHDGEPCERAIQRVLRHLRYACEMAKSGARLVRVKVGGVVYEMWVQEVE